MSLDQNGNGNKLKIIRSCQLLSGRDMSEGDCDVEDGTWRLYSERPDWADVQPVPQDDGPDPVVAIAYSEKFKDVYDYFRAVLQRKEKSLRALELTKDALELNSANYTVWQYRRELLQALDTDLNVELDYLEQVIEANPKNYQVWHHRRVIVEWMKDSSQELDLTASILEQDPKNYHAWQHRQWVIKTFRLFDKELEYVEQLLSEDVRNNSAWNQRYFVILNTTGFTDIIIQKEICFTITKIKLVKNNESSWNYLRGVLFHDKRGLSGNSIVTSFCEELYKSSNRSPFLLALIIDMCEEAIIKESESPLYNSQRGLSLCKDMADKYDKIRAKYWLYISVKFADNEAIEEEVVIENKPMRASRNNSKEDDEMDEK